MRRRLIYKKRGKCIQPHPPRHQLRGRHNDLVKLVELREKNLMRWRILAADKSSMWASRNENDHQDAVKTTAHHHRLLALHEAKTTPAAHHHRLKTWIWRRVQLKGKICCWTVKQKKSCGAKATYIWSSKIKQRKSCDAKATHIWSSEMKQKKSCGAKAAHIWSSKMKQREKLRCEGDVHLKQQDKAKEKLRCKGDAHLKQWDEAKEKLRCEGGAHLKQQDEAKGKLRCKGDAHLNNGGNQERNLPPEERQLRLQRLSRR